MNNKSVVGKRNEGNETSSTATSQVMDTGSRWVAIGNNLRHKHCGGQSMEYKTMQWKHLDQQDDHLACILRVHT